MFWAIVIVLLCICGMFLEVGATNLILARIAVVFGIDPIQFGLVFIFLLAMGQATPPFGTCLFVSCGLSGRTVGGISKQILPFVLVEIGCKHVCEHVSVRGSGADGGWREYFTAPASEVYQIDDSVDWKDAALVEPYAIGAHCTSRARIVPDNVVFILGTGTIGSIILQTCKGLQDRHLLRHRRLLSRPCEGIRRGLRHQLFRRTCHHSEQRYTDCGSERPAGTFVPANQRHANPSKSVGPAPCRRTALSFSGTAEGAR